MAKIAGSIPAEPTNTIQGGIVPVMNNVAGFGLFIDAGSIPAEPTNTNQGGIVPVMNNVAGFGLFIDAGSIPAEPTIFYGAFFEYILNTTFLAIAPLG